MFGGKTRELPHLTSTAHIQRSSITARLRVGYICDVFVLRARARVLSPSLPRSSHGPEPEPSSIDSEMNDQLSLPELLREPEHPSVSLGCRAFTGTAEVYKVHRCNSNTSVRMYRVLLLLYNRYVKCWNVYLYIIPGARFSLFGKPCLLYTSPSPRDS